MGLSLFGNENEKRQEESSDDQASIADARQPSNGEDTVRVEVTQEKSRDYTEHKAKLLNDNATPVKRVTFDYMKTKNGRVHLGNYVGIIHSPFHGESFKKETFLSFGVNQYGMETTNREKKTMTDEVTFEGDMERSEAEKADNVEILE